MAHNIAPTAHKLALLIPRLGSTFDGERLATVAAIERVLKSSGRDWHDLAGAISLDTAPAPRESSKPERGAHRDGFNGDRWRLDVRALLDGGARLTYWEKRFCTSLLKRRWPLSAKQADCLENILRKHSPPSAARRP